LGGVTATHNLTKGKVKMKKLISVVFVLLFSISAYAQVQLSNTANFVPKTLFAGTEMSERTASTSMDDTTQAFSVRGYNSAFIGIETSTNDSVKAYISYQVSKDGSSWSALAVLDSFVTSGVVGASTYLQLPAKAMGAYAVRVRVFGNALTGIVSINPSPKATTRIIRVYAGSVKQK
jgi:hypothetical protein